MKKIFTVFLCANLFMSFGICGAVEVKAGTEVFVKSTVPIVYEELYEGKQISFEVARDLNIGDTKVLKAGDPLKGEVIGGIQRAFGGYPERVFIQFTTIENGKIQLPLLKVKEWTGNGRKGLAFGLVLFTMGLSVLIPGGKVQNTQSEIMLQTVAPAKTIE